MSTFGVMSCAAMATSAARTCRGLKSPAFRRQVSSAASSRVAQRAEVGGRRPASVASKRGNASVAGGRRSLACASAASEPVQKSKLFLALEPCTVYSCVTEEKVRLTDLWGPDDRVMVAFGRHYG